MLQLKATELVKKIKKTSLRSRSLATLGLISVSILVVSVLMNKANTQSQEDTVRALPVRVVEVNYQDSHLVKHEFTGHIIAGRNSSLGFELGGKIAHIYKDNGDYAIKGEALARLDTSRTMARLRSLEAQKEAALASLHLAQRSLARREETFNDSHTSAQVLDEAIAQEASAKAQLAQISAQIDLVNVDVNTSTLKAPYDGYIDRRLLDEGVIVAAGRPVFTFLENDNFEAQIGIPNEYVSLLEVGKNVELKGEKGELLQAQVVRISPAIRGETRTQLLSLKLIDATSIGFGELVTLKVDSTRASRGFWLPITALTADVRGLWRLYKISSDPESGVPTIVIENVQILHVDDEMVFVTGSINEGEQVVSVGVSKLTPHQKVRPLATVASNSDQAQE